MRPLSIEMMNFVGYRSAEFTFDFDLAVLLGKNGSGKSTILDAITYAIWGKARASSRSLCYQGETPMSVVFCFESKGETYRICRTWTTGGLLTFETRGGVSLTGRTLKETQEAIEGVVHFSYDTFVSCVIFQQGKADYFLTVGSAARKKILEDILALDLFNKWNLHSKEKSGEVASRKKAVIYTLEVLQGQISFEREEDLESSKRDLEKVQSNLRTLVQELDSLVREATESKPHPSYLSLQDTRRQADTLLSQIKTEAKVLTESLSCPTCKRPFDSVDNKEKRLNELRAQYQMVSHDLKYRLELELEKARREEDVRQSELLSVSNAIYSIKSDIESTRIKEKEVVSLCARLETVSEYNRSLLDEIARLEKEREELVREEEKWSSLQKTFSRDGVPTRIISRALPELQELTNSFLSSLCDLRVVFDLQKDALEINVEDGSCTRAFETFSGGQGFRISFAIRLALSHLLAHRSGVQINFLAIDEGFGNQDLEGRRSLVESILRIRDQFQTILVITHMEDIASSFPVQFEVIQGELGNKIVRV